MKTTKQLGFTLIELLVVIAVIGILAATLFVIIDPTSTKNSAEDASTKSSVAGIPAAAIIYYGGILEADGATAKPQFDYTNVCNVTSIDTASDRCFSDSTTYAAESDLSGSEYFCVDSTGFAGVKNDTILTLSSTACVGVTQ